MNKTVALLKRVPTPAGHRYYTVALTANGKIRPDHVIVDGQTVHHPKVRSIFRGTQGRNSIGCQSARTVLHAEARRLAKTAELGATNRGVTVVPEENKRPLAGEIAEYLEEIRLGKKPKTHSAYKTALDYFTESCSKTYIEDVTRHDLLAYKAFLRDKKDQSPRSCANKFKNVIVFLKSRGVTGLAKRGDVPVFVQEEPEAYTDDELKTLFATATDEEKVWLTYFLMTGVRDQEAMFTEWRDIDLNHSTVRVSHKPDRDWTPKAYKEREIPVAEVLVTRLRWWKSQSGNPKGKPAADALVFGTNTGGLRFHFLAELKAVAERAELDETHFWLHKFRATFATKCLQKYDLATVQKWLGHSDIQSTMRYLKPARGEEVQKKMNEVFSGL